MSLMGLEICLLSRIDARMHIKLTRAAVVRTAVLIPLIGARISFFSISTSRAE